MIATGVLAFGAGLLVGEIFDDDDDDYYHHGSHYYPNYHGGYYPPPPRPYHYNPVYGGGYRPGYSYNRPPSYNNVLSNNNVVVVNNNRNNSYWNDFDDRATGKPRAKTLQSPITKAKPNRSDLASVNNRARSPTSQNKKVQGSYAGASKEARAKAKLPPASKVTTGKAASNAAAARNKAPARSRRPGLCRRAAGWRPCGSKAFECPPPAIGRRLRPPPSAGISKHSRMPSGRMAGGGHRKTAACGSRSRFHRSRSKPEGPVEHAAGREEQIEVGPEEAALGETP